MAARVTVEGLRGIIDTDKDDETLEAFIDTADLLVTEQLVGKGASDAMLAKIELYLSAHLLALSQELGGLTRDSYGSATSYFSDVYSAGFGSTRFGQMALTLDTTGTLQSISTVKNRAQFRLESEVDDSSGWAA